jgi:hypothetical protein
MKQNKIVINGCFTSLEPLAAILQLNLLRSEITELCNLLQPSDNQEQTVVTRKGTSFALTEAGRIKMNEITYGVICAECELFSPYKDGESIQACYNLVETGHLKRRKENCGKWLCNDNACPNFR